MAALDFPASPTVGQQYAAPNGVTYQWDGAAWVVTGGPPGQLWTGAGATLTPTDPTKQVAILGPTTPGVDLAQLILGTRTQKARIISVPASDYVAISKNRKHIGSAWVQDDTSQPSWDMAFGNVDTFAVERQPPAGAAVVLLQLDSAGRLALPGDGTAFPQIIQGAATVKSRLAAANTVPQTTWAINRDWNNGNAQDDATKPSWAIQLRVDTDQLWVQRAPAGSTTPTTPLILDNAGNLTISGATGTKASGTTWANPSDPRLKEDIAPYARGLADVVQLAPITYRLKADPNGATCYGFDAAAVQPVFPECVTETSAKLLPDDAEETVGVLSFDMHPILVALVNAVKELAARVAALETPAPTHA
jgi:hypothetical protein